MNTDTELPTSLAQTFTTLATPRDELIASLSWLRTSLECTGVFLDGRAKLHEVFTTSISAMARIERHPVISISDLHGPQPIYDDLHALFETASRPFSHRQHRSDLALVFNKIRSAWFKCLKLLSPLGAERDPTHFTPTDGIELNEHARALEVLKQGLEMLHNLAHIRLAFENVYGIEEEAWLFLECNSGEAIETASRSDLLQRTQARILNLSEHMKWVDTAIARIIAAQLLEIDSLSSRVVDEFPQPGKSAVMSISQAAEPHPIASMNGHGRAIQAKEDYDHLGRLWASYEDSLPELRSAAHCLVAEHLGPDLLSVELTATKKRVNALLEDLEVLNHSIEESRASVFWRLIDVSCTVPARDHVLVS